MAGYEFRLVPRDNQHENLIQIVALQLGLCALTGSIMGFDRKNEAVKPALYVVGQQAEVGGHVLPNSLAITLSLAQLLVEMLMAPLQRVELTQHIKPLRLRCLAHRLLELRNANAQGLDSYVQYRMQLCLIHRSFPLRLPNVPPSRGLISPSRGKFI